MITNSTSELIFNAAKQIVEPRRLRVVCAWCPDKDEKTQVALAAGERVTHGICPTCEERVR